VLLLLLGGGTAYALTRGDSGDATAGTAATATPSATPTAEPETEPDPAAAATDEPPPLTERITGDGFVAEIPSSSDGWEIGDEEGDELRVRVLRGQDGAVIRIVHSPGSDAEPDPDRVVDELPLNTAAESSRLVFVDDFPTDECADRTCSDFLLNDPAWGGLALLVNATEGDPAFAIADAIARTVRSAAQADEDPRLLAPAPGSDQSLPPESYP
jgi:hypothetical protein